MVTMTFWILIFLFSKIYKSTACCATNAIALQRPIYKTPQIHGVLRPDPFELKVLIFKNQQIHINLRYQCF